MCGVLLGIVFGLSNGAILGVSKTLLTRVFPEEKSLITQSEKQAKNPSALKQKLIEIREN